MILWILGISYSDELIANSHPIIMASRESGEKTASEERRDCPVRWTLALVGSCYPACQEIVMQDSLHTVMTPAADPTSVMFDSVQPHKRQPTRLFCPRNSLGKSTGVGCHFLLQVMTPKCNQTVENTERLRQPWCNPGLEHSQYAILCEWTSLLGSSLSFL